MVGGFSRVYEGFVNTQSQFRNIPAAAKAEAHVKREQIWRDNGLSARPKPGTAKETTSARLAIYDNAPAVNSSMAFDDKKAGLKAQSISGRFGEKSYPAKKFIAGIEQKKWIKKHKFNEIRM